MARLQTTAAFPIPKWHHICPISRVFKAMMLILILVMNWRRLPTLLVQCLQIIPHLVRPIFRK